MTPGAQIAAATTLLEEIERGGAPADDIVGNYFRRHRFAGSSDRGGISGHIYAVLRHRAALDWWIERASGGHAGEGLPVDARSRMLAALVLAEGWTLAEVDKACDGDRFRPRPLSPGEQRLLAALTGHDLLHPEMPAHVRGNFPEWLEPYLVRALGQKLTEESAALNGAASLDLRINRLKAKEDGGDRDGLRLSLRQERDVRASVTPFSPLGLRVKDRIALSTLPEFKQGLIEVQDEGSQIAALLADARPGMRVVDFCAGAGGKTLALAAEMRNRGHLIACDISAPRLERATQRLRRAGASMVQRRHLTSQRDKWVKQHAGGFDRVFVDAPCTGTGTWRRNPDAKWRLREQDVIELVALQFEILDSAERLVKPGGRLIYATCSLLVEENERQIERFLDSHPDYSVLPVGTIWHDVVGGPCPVEADMLRLTPARHGTDGFFVAVLERRAPEPAEMPHDSLTETEHR